MKQRTGTSGGLPVWTTLQTYTYTPGDPAHRPSSATDGAGQTTAYTYTATGQVATIANPKGEVTTFTYETNPASAAFERVLSITARWKPRLHLRHLRAAPHEHGLRRLHSHVRLRYDLDRVRTTTYPDGIVRAVRVRRPTRSLRPAAPRGNGRVTCTMRSGSGC